MRRCESCRNMSKSAMLEDMEESAADTVANLVAIWAWGIWTWIRVGEEDSGQGVDDSVDHDFF